MKKIRPEEVDNVPLVRRRPYFGHRSDNSAVIDAVAELEVGEGLQFSESDWVGPSSPTVAIPSYTQVRRKGNKFNYTYVFYPLARKMVCKKFSVRKTLSGWLVVRLKDRPTRPLYQEMLRAYDRFMVAWDNELEQARRVVPEGAGGRGAPGGWGE